jgi:hypothetical protein
MSICPICRAAWPVASSLPQAVCPACFAVFQRNQDQWQQVPPGWDVSAPIPFPLGTPLRLRSVEYRVVGFASYSYEVEYGRDQWETYERHEYTLVDVTGSNPRLLCWTSSNWFLARPVDPSQVISKSWAEAEFEGRAYKKATAKQLHITTRLRISDPSVSLARGYIDFRLRVRSPRHRA